jgi:DNA-binding PadR family transcriptional regulator
MEAYPMAERIVIGNSYFLRLWALRLEVFTRKDLRYHTQANAATLQEFLNFLQKHNYAQVVGEIQTGSAGRPALRYQLTPSGVAYLSQQARALAQKLNELAPMPQMARHIPAEEPAAPAPAIAAAEPVALAEAEEAPRQEQSRRAWTRD